MSVQSPGFVFTAVVATASYLKRSVSYFTVVLNLLAAAILAMKIDVWRDKLTTGGGGVQMEHFPKSDCILIIFKAFAADNATLTMPSKMTFQTIL